jgi:hypothetical protein
LLSTDVLSEEQNYDQPYLQTDCSAQNPTYTKASRHLFFAADGQEKKYGEECGAVFV